MIVQLVEGGVFGAGFLFGFGGEVFIGEEGVNFCFDRFD